MEELLYKHSEKISCCILRYRAHIQPEIHPCNLWYLRDSPKQLHLKKYATSPLLEIKTHTTSAATSAHLDLKATLGYLHTSVPIRVLYKGIPVVLIGNKALLLLFFSFHGRVWKTRSWIAAQHTQPRPTAQPLSQLTSQSTKMSSFLLFLLPWSVIKRADMANRKSSGDIRNQTEIKPPKLHALNRAFPFSVWGRSFYFG